MNGSMMSEQLSALLENRLHHPLTPQIDLPQFDYESFADAV